MDQVIEVARYLFSESVHHEVHPFLHHLHLCDYVGGAISMADGWLVSCRFCLLEALLPSGLLIPSFSAGSFLVLLLGVKCCIFLAQLLL